MTFRSLLVMLLMVLGLSPSAHALSNGTWADISDVGEFTLIVSSMAAPAILDDWKGFRQAGYSLGTAQGIALLGKALVHEQRPDNTDNNSFPSGHTSVSFAAATTMYRRHGWKMGFPAYALATLTGSARVAARKHYWHDVVAGAAVGIASGWLFTDAFNDKVQLLPWVDSNGGGVIVTMGW